MLVSFTLAEVLITLGIIGIVAAMTLPALISNHSRKEVATRLKQDYSLLSQALGMAQAEYGDVKNWQYTKFEDLSDAENIEFVITNFVETYISKYLKTANKGRYTSLAEAGYPIYLTPLNQTNSNLSSLNKKYYILELANGSTIFFDEESSNVIIIYIDVNGKKKPNKWGYDAFMYRIETNYGRISPWNSSSSRAFLISECGQGDARSCSRLIMFDGWEIKEDYPIKL